MSGSDLPFVSVSVPVLNGEETIGDCLASLLRVDYPPERREIVVVDNGSTDRTVDIVARFPVRYVVEERRGLSNARNRGILESRAEILAFTDCDCFASTGWLKELVAGFGEEVSAVVGEVVAHPVETPAQRYAARRKPARMGWTLGRGRPWITFETTAVRRSVFDRIGLFDPRFAGAAEDIDLSWRFFGAGLELRSRPRAIVFHRHRPTVRGLFRQQLGYGRDQAMLRGKYPELGWSLRDELAAWADLSTTALAAATAQVRPGDGSYTSYDLLRKLGQRVGFLKGTVEFWLGP